MHLVDLAPTLVLGSRRMVFPMVTECNRLVSTARQLSAAKRGQWRERVIAECERVPCRILTWFTILGTTYDGAGRLVCRAAKRRWTWVRCLPWKNRWFGKCATLTKWRWSAGPPSRYSIVHSIRFTSAAFKDDASEAAPPFTGWHSGRG